MAWTARLRFLGRHAVRVGAHACSVLSLAAFTFAAGAAHVAGTHSADGDGLRGMVERRLAEVVGRGGRAEVGNLRFRFAAKGRTAVDVHQAVLRTEDGSTLELGAARVEFELLPLLAGRAEAKRIVVRDAVVNVAGLLRGHDADPLTALAKVDLGSASQAFGQGLRALEGAIRRAGAETVLLENVRLHGVTDVAGETDAVRISRAQITRDERFTRGLRLEGSALLGRSVVRLSGAYERQGGAKGSRDLRLAARGLDLAALPRLRPASKTPFGVHAVANVSLRTGFGSDGSSEPIFVNVDLGSGHGWFADDEPTALDFARLRLRATPERNSIAVLPSPFQTASVSGSLTGGVAWQDDRLEFELVGDGLRSTAGGVAREQRASLRIAGHLDPTARRTRFDAIQLSAPGGDVSGFGEIDFARWTPAMRFDIRSNRLTVETARAFWPPFIAHDQRRFATGGAFDGGAILGGELSLDVPATVMGRLRTDATLEPGQLSMHLPFRGVSARTVGDLPRIDAAHGTVRVEGTSLVATLDRGTANVDGRAVSLSDGVLSIGSFLEPGLPATIAFQATGEARSMLAIGSRHPLRVTQAAGLVPDNTTGTAELAVEIATRLRLPPGARPDDWTVRADVRNGATPSFRGRKVAKANLAIVATPGTVQIDGAVRVDGVDARLALVEPFGPDGKGGAARTATLRLDEKGRRALGLRLGDYVSGTVEAAVTDLGGGRQRVSVDLAPAKISVPFLPWDKGPGVPGRLDFVLETDGTRTRLTDVRLSGKAFTARGALSFDRDGLRSADLPIVRLGATDSFAISAQRRKGIYAIDILGSELDLRSIMRKLATQGSPSAGGGSNLRVSARFARVRGHNKQVITGATLNLDMRKGAIRELDFRGVTGTQAPLSASVKASGTKGDTLVALDGEDAGALLAFADIYSKMRGGTLRLRLRRDRGGILAGHVQAERFTVFGERRLRQLVAKHNRTNDGDGVRRQALDPNRAVVKRVRADIRKGPGFLSIRDGQLRGGDMAAIFEGTVYDRRGRIAMKGTFLPAYGLNRALSNIPVLGYAMGNGRKRGLLGITFRLRGKSRDPRLEVNPISLLTPGVFRRIFE